METEVKLNIEKTLLEIVRIAHKWQVREDEELSYIPFKGREVSYVHFDEDLQIQHTYTSSNSTGGTFELTFQAIGELKEVLISNKIYEEFYIVIYNIDFYDDILINSDFEIDRYIASCNINFDTNNITLKDMQNCNEALEMFYTFYLTKFI